EHGQLTAGHQKDVVISNQLTQHPDRVAIYGWHRTNGIAIQPLEVRAVAEYDAAFAAMKTKRADAVIVQASLTRKVAAELALKQRLPAVSFTSLFAREGGVLTYAANQNDVFRRSAYYIDRILKGAKPADLPVEQPTRYELTINLQTAKAIGIAVPRELRIRADEVIE
ncbi:MAG: ABC transporter substrate binding protein, partial [Burkholderiaceae bacterium]